MALGASLSAAVTKAAQQVGKETLKSALTRSLAATARNLAEQGIPFSPAVRRVAIQKALPRSLWKGESANAFLRRARQHGMGIRRQDILKMRRQVKSWVDAQKGLQATDAQGYTEPSSLPQITDSPGAPYHAAVRVKYHDKATGQFRYRHITVDYGPQETDADIMDRAQDKLGTWQKAGRYEDMGQIDQVELAGKWS